MEKDKISEFTVRVTQASKTELVVIMYDILLSDIVEARNQLSMGNKDEYQKELKHACRIINELMATLNYTIEMSRDLLSLYSFANKRIILAMMKKDTTLLDGVESIINDLRAAFAEISKQDFTGPVMENTQQVYAGLTYGRGTLNESFYNLNGQNRGFKA